MHKVFKTFVVSLFVIAIATFAGASPADNITLATANVAFARAEVLKKQQAPQVEAALLSRFSRGPVPLALPTPKEPEVYFAFGGVDEKNNVHVLLDILTGFPPVRPLEVFVNGFRTTKDGVFQTTSDASPRSPYGLAGSAVAEIHGLSVILPGKIGFNNIETQVYWHPDFYFPKTYEQTIDHLGANFRICLNADGTANVVFVFDTFDQTFPAKFEITMNGIRLVSMTPVKVDKKGFLAFVSMKLSNADYVLLSEDANQRGTAFVLREMGDVKVPVIVQWYDYLPLIQYLPTCDVQCGYDPQTGLQLPCPPTP
jgi:hypothetical protein